jgi:hypothetical protein
MYFTVVNLNFTEFILIRVNFRKFRSNFPLCGGNWNFQVNSGNIGVLISL